MGWFGPRGDCGCCLDPCGCGTGLTVKITYNLQFTNGTFDHYVPRPDDPPAKFEITGIDACNGMYEILIPRESDGLDCDIDSSFDTGFIALGTYSVKDPAGSVTSEDGTLRLAYVGRFFGAERFGRAWCFPGLTCSTIPVSSLFVINWCGSPLTDLGDSTFSRTKSDGVTQEQVGTATMIAEVVTDP